MSECFKWRIAGLDYRLKMSVLLPLCMPIIAASKMHNTRSLPGLHISWSRIHSLPRRQKQPDFNGFRVHESQSVDHGAWSLSLPLDTDKLIQ
ncbi:hypothetical protein GE09DRAFT_513826 [Coniochaeta sp. 2T2.1]|nr:hypothetical protein GE09DRAFT_513826 [Coniochaeta sp. 2T2.1]